jgi:hypothetical protein
MSGRSAMLGVLLPTLALAHETGPLQPDDLWTAWSFDPGIVIPLALAALLYLRGARGASGAVGLCLRWLSCLRYIRSAKFCFPCTWRSTKS